jgi:subtilisin family serine protease
VLTTDIPGHHGYSGGQLEGIQPPSVENADRAGLYTVFGGTSAASAIVAGAAALLQSKHRSARGPLNGMEVKAKMALSGAKNVSWPWLGRAEVPILPDSPNGETKPPSFDQQFGAGLLDLRKLLS